MCSNMIQTKPIIYEEIALVISLFPFLWIYLYSELILTQFIAMTIFVNGTMCHLSIAFSYKYLEFFKNLDIISNGIMITYVNCYTKWQPCSIITSVSGIVIYFLNKTQYESWVSTFIHIFFVQWYGALVLYYFEY